MLTENIFFQKTPKNTKKYTKSSKITKKGPPPSRPPKTPKRGPKCRLFCTRLYRICPVRRPNDPILREAPGPPYFRDFDDF